MKNQNQENFKKVYFHPQKQAILEEQENYKPQILSCRLIFRAQTCFKNFGFDITTTGKVQIKLLTLAVNYARNNLEFYQGCYLTQNIIESLSFCISISRLHSQFQNLNLYNYSFFLITQNFFCSFVER
ncbi:unnamed protein product [Paramecium pentaurelia]|uniref:Uncharacterized protein n=1 Tax=Paramecium pentaurelia TaxID=43138 RepID=A0A8S1WP62_9CILI|nr:unnamed protein product [Paramecium pentaurelia]